MKVFHRISLLTVLFGFLLGSPGCGNVDPLSVFGDTNPPALEPIFAFGTGGPAIVVNGFTSQSPYWAFTQGFFFGGNVLAPAKGVVSSLGTDTATNSTFVTIAHSGRLATRIAGVIPTVRSGDMVVSGQIIGTFVGSGMVTLQVLLNGSAVCPLSFISQSFRSQIYPYFQVAGALCI